VEVRVIRRGRSVVDREGVGRLHKLSWDVARRVMPWAEPDHPRPVNQPEGEPPRRRVRALWDTEQARAYAVGRTVPEIDVIDHPDDLLDDREVAALHGLTTGQFHRIRNDNRISVTIPEPDATFYGVAHWRRVTAEAMRLHAPRADATEPREPRRYGPRAERREILAAEASAMAETGKPINISELARRAGVSRMTARAFLRDHASEDSAQP
jgi:hypothetical protein